MKTKQEQIEKMARTMCGYCSTDGKCAVSKNLREPEICANVDTQHCLYKEHAEELIENSYGDVSEYKAENERLTKILNSLTFSRKETDMFGKPALLMFAGVKVEEAIKRVTEYNGLKAEIERLKAEYEKLQTNAEILASGVRDLNHENYELTQKLAKQTRIARDANAKFTGVEHYLKPFQYKADRLQTKCDDLKKLSDWQREEIKRLKDDYANLQEQFAQYQMASDKEIRAQVKQAKIDMLNEAKKCSCCDNFFPDGQWHRFVFVSDIDILIKRVKNDK